MRDPELPGEEVRDTRDACPSSRGRLPCTIQAKPADTRGGEGAEDVPRLGGLALRMVPLWGGEPEGGLSCLLVC